jgi:hypothetical protein
MCDPDFEFPDLAELMAEGERFYAEHRKRQQREALTTLVLKVVVDRAPSGFLVEMLTPPDFAEEALANIGARYEYWVAKHGARGAALIFHRQCARAVLSCWADWLRKRLKLLEFLRPS